MSMNAYNQHGNFRSIRNNLAERELDQELASATLADGYDSGLAPQPELLRRIRQEKTVSWVGLAALFMRADDAFKNTLPWNLTLSDAGWKRVHAARESQGRRGFIPRDATAEEVVRKHARLSGWLVAAAKLRGLRKAIKKNVSSRGVNSPYTRFSLWDVAERRPSPGQLDRALWAVKERADALVGSFRPGHRASWYALLQAVVYGPRQTCKAAVIAAAMTLLPDARIRLYRDARNALAALASAKVADNSDGVVGRRMEAPTYSKSGISVYVMYIEDSNWFGFKEVHLIRREADGRTYHAEPNSGMYRPGKSYVVGPKGQILAALDAWRSQAA